MSLLDYTTADDIRAVLGVSSDELEDATLSLAVYEYSLIGELEDVSLTLISGYASIKDTDVEGMNEVESRFYRGTRLFSTYVVARNLLSSLPLFSPKEISDGKATQVRFAQDPYKETIKRVEQLYERHKERLVTALAAFSLSTAAPATVRPYLVVSSPNSDPVTGT